MEEPLAERAPRRRRREAIDWATEDELEILRGLDEKPADWSVLSVAAGEGEPDAFAELARLAEPTEPATPAAAPAPRRAADVSSASERPKGRRTVVIRGRVAPGPPVTRAASSAQRHRRPADRRRDRVAHRPDQVAMWAVLLGVMLILAAALL